MAGMLAQNVLNGDMPLGNWQEFSPTDTFVLDVREPHEFSCGHVPRAINLPLSELRTRHTELPKDRDIHICCGVGQRAYYAARFLLQHGYRAKTLSGGLATYNMQKAAGLVG